MDYGNQVWTAGAAFRENFIKHSPLDVGNVTVDWRVSLKISVPPIIDGLW